MGRLDELNAILDGHAPKPKQTGGITMPSRIDGFQDNLAMPEDASKSDEKKVTASKQRDFGTKKDPAKLRKQVSYNKIGASPIDEIMK